MPRKKSKKKRSKKLSSSSSEEDLTSSQEHDVTSVCKSAKKKQHGSSSDRCTDNQKSSGSLTITGVPQSGRQIKKAVYSLAKKPTTDQRPDGKEEKCATPKRVFVPYNKGSCYGQEKASVSGKAMSSKTVEMGPSKPRSTHRAGGVPQKTEKTTQGKLDNESSQRSHSKSTKKLKRYSLDSTELTEQKHISVKRQHIHEEPPRMGQQSTTSKTREPSKTSSLSKNLRERRRKLVTKMRQKQRVKDLKAEASLCAERTAGQSCTLAKPTTSHSSSNVFQHPTPKQENIPPVSHKIAYLPCSHQEIPPVTPTLPPNFKIPKKALFLPARSTVCNNDGTPTNSKNRTSGTEPSESGSSVNNTRQGTPHGVHFSAVVTTASPLEGQYASRRSTISGPFPTLNHTNTMLQCDQNKVVEELHYARSHKRLEVDVMQSYGELTCMDIDPPEEGTTDTPSKQGIKRDVILVLDTNILLKHLEYVKKIRSHGLGALGFPVILIPWVVLQELDSLKMGNRLSGSAGHLVGPAIKYIHSCVKSREPNLWGQSMQQAAQSSYGLTAENNDDRVLQCCLQYQSLYPESPVILCTDDRNLCSKSILSGVKAFSKDDLVKEVESFRHGDHSLELLLTPTQPQNNPQVSTPMLSKTWPPAQSQSRHTTIRHSLGQMEQDEQLFETGKDEEEKRREVSRVVSEMEECLREVLSDVLEVEMKTVYEDLWLEIVYKKPPWTLQDVLQCMRKHWIAVFGLIVPRKKLEAVVYLIHFFTSEKTVECSTTFEALREAKGLLKVFERRSSRVPAALSLLDNIFHRPQPQGEAPVSDADMSDEQATSSDVSHQEVWALFENIGNKMYHISLNLFQALHFSPQTMQRDQTAGGPPPPQDTLVGLHKLTSMVSQLHQAFSRVLSSVTLEETQTLLNFIHSNEIAAAEVRFTAEDLLDCFSQEEYRNKLRIGWTQLADLKMALERCAEAVGQHVPHTT